MAKQTSRKRSSAGSKSAGVLDLDLSRVRFELQAWYQRTLNVDTAGEYGKVLRTIEFFMTRAEMELGAILWDRATQVALDEALQYLVHRWGPKFREPLHMELRLTDTHVKFSVTVPAEAIIRAKGARVGLPDPGTEERLERGLYVVMRLMDRLQIGPEGRQLVFRRLVRPLRLPAQGLRWGG